MKSRRERDARGIDWSDPLAAWGAQQLRQAVQWLARHFDDRLLSRGDGTIHRWKLISYSIDMNSVVASSPFTLAESPSRSELLAKYFRGLGDPTRLRILWLLQDSGELAVGEIVDRLELPQATVSTHLGCLRWCGFVVTRRNQRSVIYRLADERVSELVSLADSLLADNAEHVACCQTIK